MEWWNPLYRYDRIYSSKVFDFTPVDPYLPDDAIRGGTGYRDIPIDRTLPDEIDGMFPDTPYIRNVIIPLDTLHADARITAGGAWYHERKEISDLTGNGRRLLGMIRTSWY